MLNVVPFYVIALPSTMHSIYSMFLCNSTNASLVSNAMKVLHISSTSPGKGMLHTIEVGCVRVEYSSG